MPGSRVAFECQSTGSTSRLLVDMAHLWFSKKHSYSGGGGDKYSRLCSALCKQLLPLVLGAILGSEMQCSGDTVSDSWMLHFTAQNGTEDELEKPLTWHVAAPAVLTALPPIAV